ncbi:sodium:calcium antiporter [Microvirga makkahensis]|uniref:Sodium:calcium antiporter n=1 Tax=Microvirga makkahensis TaxID=1128670 RepID=A0A7X3MQH6_9HYPH|nr:sodium:calcium antiporter [Microvirga makkahensis]MXQ11173.1 sodium:calcium antiporter [Microvirga makkahensis]
MAFDNLSIWLNGGIFAASAVIVWLAGSRLALYVDGIAGRTGIGQAFTGMLLLGGITSLPEIATVTTASWTGNAPLAVNNLLGSASINILLLAIADAVLGRNALTSVIGKPATLLQGTLGMMLMAAVAAVVLARDVPVAGVGLGSTVLIVLCFASLWLSSGYERRHVWTAIDDEPDTGDVPGDDEQNESQGQKQSLRTLVIKTIIVGVVILGAGFLLSQTGDAIAKQTGLGASLVGLVLVGFATSLPELSSIIAAVRIRRYEMAVGDIFGTNLFNIALIFLADLAYPGGPVLAQAGAFESVAALVGLALTGVFVVGLLERRDRTVARMGYDSLAAIVLYVAGLVLLYVLDQRSGSGMG